MDKNYIKFIIAYDYGSRLDEMELACDEAFDLANEIADRYIRHTKANNIDQWYGSLQEFCEDLSFADVWEQMKFMATMHTKYDNVYEEQICISANEFSRINRLLAIESLEDMTDDELAKQGANTNSCEGIFHVEFADGSSLNFDLCSGQHNYWDDVVWTSADGKTDVVLNCEYELNDIEFAHENNFYIVRIVKV